MSHSQKMRRRSCLFAQKNSAPTERISKSLFLKPVEKAQASLKFDKNNRVSYMMTKAHLRKYLAEFFSGWGIFQTKCV